MRIPIVGNVVEVVAHGEVIEENQYLKGSLRRSGMGRRGPAVVLHPERGRDRRQGPRRWALSAGASWPRSSSVCCRRTPTRICTLNAAWKPAPPVAPVRGKFTMADLLKYAGGLVLKGGAELLRAIANEAMNRL